MGDGVDRGPHTIYVSYALACCTIDTVIRISISRYQYPYRDINIHIAISISISRYQYPYRDINIHIAI